MSGDIVDVLRSMAAAYPEDIFPVPPSEKQAKDGAAAHVLRVVAVPHFVRAADEIERLRAGIEDAIGWTDSGGECGQRLYNLLHPGPVDNGQAIAPPEADQNGRTGAPS